MHIEFMKSSLILTSLAVMLVVAGCGGGDSSASGSGQSDRAAAAHPVTLSKAQVLEKADAICRRMNTEFAAHEPHSQGIAESARIVPHRVVVEQRVIGELNQLAPAAAIATDLRRVIAFRSTLERELAELANVAEHRDTARFHQLASSKARVHSELLAVAQGGGFKECGRTG
jgi:hypothetical protein